MICLSIHAKTLLALTLWAVVGNCRGGVPEGLAPGVQIGEVKNTACCHSEGWWWEVQGRGAAGNREAKSRLQQAVLPA